MLVKNYDRCVINENDDATNILQFPKVIFIFQKKNNIEQVNVHLFVPHPCLNMVRINISTIFVPSNI